MEILAQPFGMFISKSSGGGGGSSSSGDGGRRSRRSSSRRFDDVELEAAVLAFNGVKVVLTVDFVQFPVTAVRARRQKDDSLLTQITWNDCVDVDILTAFAHRSFKQSFRVFVVWRHHPAASHLIQHIVVHLTNQFYLLNHSESMMN